jgi:uncharacterized membrane protein YfcA
MAILGSTRAVPLVIILSLANCLYLGVRIRREARLGLVFGLLGGAVLGLPIGVVVFQTLESRDLMIAVSLMVLGFAVCLGVRGRPSGALDQASDRGSAAGPPESVPFRRSSVIGVGVVAGAMTASLGIPGPPVVLYLMALRVSKNALRATTLVFFAAVYVSSLALQAAVVGLPERVAATALLLTPVVVFGGWLGNRLAAHIDESTFRWIVLGLIVLTGAASLVSAFVG